MYKLLFLLAAVSISIASFYLYNGFPIYGLLLHSEPSYKNNTLTTRLAIAQSSIAVISRVSLKRKGGTVCIIPYMYPMPMFGKTSEISVEVPIDDKVTEVLVCTEDKQVTIWNR